MGTSKLSQHYPPGQAENGLGHAVHAEPAAHCCRLIIFYYLAHNKLFLLQQLKSFYFILPRSRFTCDLVCWDFKKCYILT